MTFVTSLPSSIFHAIFVMIRLKQSSIFSCSYFFGQLIFLKFPSWSVGILSSCLIPFPSRPIFIGISLYPVYFWGMFPQLTKYFQTDIKCWSKYYSLPWVSSGLVGAPLCVGNFKPTIEINVVCICIHFKYTSKFLL